MDLPIFAVAALGLAALSATGTMTDHTPAHKAEGPAALVGERLYATEDRVANWGAPVRPEALGLEDLGTVTRVVTGPRGEAEAIVVAVGGLWGLGAQEVELGMERVHLLRATGGGPRLVVDLSAEGAQPAPEDEALDL
ncbi:hypothetical protein [Rubellimicrobium roseum]|uniref:PRC-barrel domain containing protein n=1 Tax=Rubellimicrobium roseum TaxID=687525 RepID=A0A5C4NFY0_9RHOB|nr:hypothetical protein [Rubellimicrobium roseum]TNC73032.1 hypothetical protein FHG71_06975 [Rubellimicrobium roseum]